MEEGFMLAHSSRLLFVWLGKLRQQGFEAAGGRCLQSGE